MGANPIRALLFLAGGVVAALVTAYVTGAFDPDTTEAPKVAAVPPDAANPQTPAAKGDRPQGQASEPAETSAPADGASPAAGETPQAAKPDIIVPSFDLVRVEGDGSLVVAGKAAPSARIEVLTGSTVVGETQAEPGGDFVSVLDTPLEPGEYQVVLRSTTPDNVVAMSTETAVISIPDQPDGQVLALVEEPGKPSELITVPEPEASAEPTKQTETAEAPAASAPATGAAETPATGQAAQAPAVAAAPSAGETAAGGEQEQAATQPQSPAQPAAPENGATEMAANEPAAAQPGAEAPAPAASSSAGQPEAVAQVKVEAVEIEGRKVFVAGSADPGSVVRVYANDALLGETRAGPNGRFLVETERDMPVGDYIIRADLLDEGGSEVLARAAVPFEREPGEMIAAVAPSIEPAAPQADADAQAAPAEQAGSATQTGEAPAAGQQAVSAPAASQPAGDAQASASGGEAGSGQPASDAASGQPASGGSEPSAAPAAPADGATQPPADGSSQVAAAGEGTTLPELGTGIAGQAPQVTDARLEPVKGAVIIRRGDSLWRISRRVYGRGIRYSTIYLANQDQIRDPDRIWPGQVFAVPKTTEEGETADMGAMGEQATTR